MIKVLFISGSGRKGGNTDFLMEQAMIGAKEAETGVEVSIDSYYMRGKKFAGCLNCFKCAELEGECTIKDSFQELRDKWVASDVIIYSIPVYHMTIPGQMRCFMDRLGNTQFVYHNMSAPKTMKVIGGIAQGIHIFSGQEHALTDLMNHAYISGAVYCTGDMWENYIGAGGWTLNEADKDALKKQYEAGELDALVAVKACRSLGKRCVELATIMQSGALKHKEVFDSQPIYVPFANRLAEVIEEEA